MKNGQYTGPILFIIHAPIKEKELGPNNEANFDANKRRILHALNKAGRYGLPVLYAPHDDKIVKEVLSEAKHRPRVIEFLGAKEFWGRSVFSSRQLREVLLANNIIPTKITLLGQLRNWCVKRWAVASKKAFPNASVTILEGTSTIFQQIEGVKRKNERERYKKVLRKYKIQRSKNLSAKHLRP